MESISGVIRLADDNDRQKDMPPPKKVGRLGDLSNADRRNIAPSKHTGIRRGGAQRARENAATVNNNDNSNNPVTNTANVNVSMTVNEASAPAALGQSVAKPATDEVFNRQGPRLVR